jgi:hypothetical protein
MLRCVRIGVTLADIGQAIAVARHIDLRKMMLGECKSGLHIDVTHANAAARRWDAAMDAVRAVEQVAPQEMRTRAAGKQLVATLATRGPNTVRTDAIGLARPVGIAL